MTETGKLEVKEFSEGIKVHWEIPAFFSLEKDLIHYGPDFKFLNTFWYLKIDPSENNSSDHLALYLKMKTDVLSCNVMCTFGINKVDGSLTRISSANHTFTCDSNQLAFRNFCRRSDLSENESELLPSNNLTIVCKLKYQRDSMKLTGLNTLSEKIKGFFISKEFCDVTLHVKDKEFKTHKIILAARSPVFAAMFKYDTSENQTGVVYIPDCDPESFRDFLFYLYSGEFEDISFRNVLHVYKAADKYDVQELKISCIEFMSQNLEVENFCEVITLAEEYDEENLSAIVQKFFNKNLKEILASDEWKELFEKNFNLANKLLLQMATKVKVIE